MGTRCVDADCPMKPEKVLGAPGISSVAPWDAFCKDTPSSLPLVLSCVLLRAWSSGGLSGWDPPRKASFLSLP